ncbi:MAG: 2-C-methyl-D-erythritol 4-phosphate cytidylyltransferase [bacterium]|nr:2-C-methyl-D-erythritol 4-phosphate cytidylyltransferase [bacterium]
MQKFSVIITAGGTSSRYGNKNKLLELIDQKTVIEYATAPFLEFENITEIIIAANKSIIENLQKLFKDFRIKIIEGGETRQASVYKALCHTKEDYVIIHDGARPLIDKETIKNVMQRVVEYSAVSVMTKTTDTIKEVTPDGKIIRTIDRSKLYNTQTPQAFQTKIIKNAHEKLVNQTFTDDSSMLEALGLPVYMVNGNYKNIKITSKPDLDFAKLYIQSN